MKVLTGAILALAVSFPLSSNADVLDTVDELGKAAITAAADAYNGSHSSATLTRAVLDNKLEVTSSAVIGNGGIDFNVHRTEVTDSELYNDTRVDKSLLFGNGGIRFGQTLY